MTAPRLSDVLKGGTGTVDYALHVGGMPWVAVTSKSLSTHLQALTDDALSNYFCRRGGGIGEHRLGSHMQYLTALDVGNTSWSWKHDDADGLTGGSWQVRIHEIHPGIDWSRIDGEGSLEYNLITSSPIWGVPGVSQMFDHLNDTAIMYGEIAEDVAFDDYAIKIRDIRGIGRYLTSIGLDGAVIWIGHEAILIDSAVDNEDGTFTATVNSEGRGIYFTRRSPHAVNEYSSISELVSSAPIGGICGRPAVLWAFASADSGSTYGTGTIVAHGQVLQGISIKKGVATVKCGSPIDWLKAPSAAPQYSGGLRRYVLQRGEIGTAETADYGPAGYGSLGIAQSQMRAPHIVIYERDVVDGDYVEHTANIWLCEKDSSVIFDSIDALLAAIQTELDLLSDGSSSQKSGDNTTGNPEESLYFRYVVSRDGIAIDQEVDDTGFWVPSSGKTRRSMISGVIPVVFGLTHAKSAHCSYAVGTTFPIWDYAINDGLKRDEIAKRLAFPGEYKHSLGDRNMYFAGFQIGNYTDDEAHLQKGFAQHAPPRDLISEFAREARNRVSSSSNTKYPHFPIYYYESGFSDDLDPAQNSTNFSPTGIYGVPDDGSGNPRLWLDKGVGHVPSVGARIYLGPDEGNPQLYGDINDAGTDGDYYYVDVSSQPTGIGAYALMAPEGTESPMRGRFHVLGYIQAESVPTDPFAVSQGRVPVSSTDSTELFAGALGSSYSVVMAPSQTLYWVPLVGETEGGAGTSWIDWENLAEKTDPLFRNESYSYRPGEQTWWEYFTEFLKSHGMIPYLELVDDTNESLWKMRFRPIGVVNYSDAVMYGRSISNDTFADEYNITRDIASGHVYGSMEISLNYDGNEYGATIKVADKGAYTQNGFANKVYKIDDRVTWSYALRKLETDKSVQAEISERYTSAILPHLSRPRPITTADCTARAWLLPVGGDVLATDAYGKNPFTGAVGYTGLPGLVTSLSVDLGSLKAKCSWRLARSVSKGWAPALYMPGGCLTETSSNVWDVALSGGSGASAHEFSGSTDPSDWSRFDCWDYDPLTATYGARQCTCGDYCVRIFRPDRPLDTVWYGTCSVTGLAPGGTPTMTLSIVGELPTAFPMILEFGLYDDAESCQRDLYVAYCGDNGVIGTGEYPGDTWV